MYLTLAELLQPLPLGSLVALVMWGAAYRRHHAWRRVLLTLFIPWGVVMVSCTPAAAYLAAGAFEWWYRPLHHPPSEAQAIVVLGSGRIPPDVWIDKTRLDDDSIARCLHGAELYHAGERRPVVVCGGKRDKTEHGQSLAHVMRELLMRLGVAEEDIVMEETSRDTFENATATAGLLEPRGIRRIVLVTDATHMARAARSFRGQGSDVIPAPCNYRATQFAWRPTQFLPQARGARDMQAVCHEIVGTIDFWIQGRP